MNLFVSGTGTDVGKTIVSAILVEALKADYWKPVQAGSLTYTDTHQVRDWVSNGISRFHQETYSLTTPASPHYSAELDGITIDMEAFRLPATDHSLVVEGAGGLLVPLNKRYLIIDLIRQLALPVVLVSRHFLGSINQTLLSVEALQRRDIPVAGIIFSGASKPSTEDYIRQYTGVPILARIDEEDTFDRATIAGYAQTLRTAIEN